MKRLLIITGIALMATPACDPPPPVTTVGPDGGAVVSDDGRLRIWVPRGALQEEITLTIGHHDDCYEIGPHGTNFAVPAQITLDAPIDYHWDVLDLGDDSGGTLCPSNG
jgi:hypothetical protein